MKILHTADIHLGQVIYQNYDRCDEHDHFFDQLKRWCTDCQPDALIISGDIYDIQQPSAATRKAFAEYISDIRLTCPEMHIIVTAGNHDSASRIEADSPVWALAGMTLVGTAPSTDLQEGWEDKFIVALPTGYIIAMPYMTSERTDVLQRLLDKVEEMNTDGLPVVMMGHATVEGLDPAGHEVEVGTLRAQDTAAFGKGYDYLALGHFHKPQTIGHLDDSLSPDAKCYPAPVIRYSGSALHVSCDERYPHSVSCVEIDRHGGTVTISPLRIDEYRHFFELPADGSSFTDAESAVKAIEQFVRDHERGYFRLRIQHDTPLPADFNQKIYDILSPTNDEIRFNPKITWTGQPAADRQKSAKPTFEVAELQQMTDPLTFVEKTLEQYPGLDLDEVREAFVQVKAEIQRMEDEELQKAAAKQAGKKESKKNENENENRRSSEGRDELAQSMPSRDEGKDTQWLNA